MTAAILAGFFSGVIGGMGLGGGAVLLIYLTVFAGVDQMAAQGINLFFFLPIGLTAVCIYAFRRQMAPRTVGFMVAGGLPGAAIGWLFSRFLGGNWLRILFAVLLLAYGLKEIICASVLIYRQKHDKIEKKL